MTEAQKVPFSLEELKIPRFSYNEDNHEGDDLRVGFIPKGEYNTSKGTYKLYLDLVTKGNKSGDPVFQISTIAIFKFTSSIEFSEIPPYFYTNAIAIIFPYIRAFVSTLTLQANTKLLKLGLMNLTELAKPLKENTIMTE